MCHSQMLVSGTVCEAVIHGFDSRMTPNAECGPKVGPLALGARHRVSSILTTPINAVVAQLAEQRFCKPQVEGSIPFDSFFLFFKG